MAYRYYCKVCDEQTFLFANKPAATACRKCGGKTKRTAKGPTQQVRETKDNGWMPQAVDQLQNEEDLHTQRNEFEKASGAAHNET